MNKTSLKIATALFSVIFVLSVFPNVRVNAEDEGYGGTCGDNLEWTYEVETDTLTITGEGPMYDYTFTDPTHRSPFSTMEVESIFEIKKVVIGSGVTSIGTDAFNYCRHLTNISIPDSVTSIGLGAFEDCYSLTSIKIPNSVTTIQQYAFDDCVSLESVSIPDSVTSIESNVFKGCSSLKSVDIPDSVTSIDSQAFSFSGLTSITIPDSVTSIGNGAFLSCTSLTSITISDSVASIGREAFANTGLTNVIIPESVNWLGEYAFGSCSNLESVEIDKGLYDNLDASVFERCPKLVGESNSITCCKVTFVNEGGTVLQSEKTILGTPIYYGSTPVKPTDSQHYTFSGWNDGTTTYSPDALPVLTADTTFTAQYTINKYTVTFNNYDGTEISSAQYDYGTNVVAIVTPPTTPSRDADEKYTYTFIGWDNEIADVTGDVVYTAQYSTTTNQYTVTFKNYDDKVLSSTAYDYDTKAEDIKVPTPSRDADTQYTYTFTGWDKEIAEVTGDATYTAQYSSTVNKYTVKFVDEEGNVLQSGEVAYGTAPEYTGTPSKAETDTATYAFAGWTDGTTTYGAADRLPTVTGAVTYKAVFTETLKPIEAETTIVKPVETPIEVAQPAPITYTIGEVKGDGINSDIVIDVHRSEDDANCISYFRSVTNNGVAMKNGEQYTAVTGSTIITIKSDYIKTLPAGEYTITVNFKDGSVSATITIPERSGTSVPSTGESISPAVYVGVALILVSCAATGFILTKKRREEV